MPPLKCFFGFHKWEKYMGPGHAGGGKFAQKYKCAACGRIKERVS